MRRTAIVGGGISGLVTAWLLQHDHEVTLYEAAPWLGGHAHSIEVPCEGGSVWAETGFKYFLRDTYPTMMALTRTLGLTIKRHLGPVCVQRPGRGVMVLPPRTLPQLTRLLSPRALREAVGLLRFMGSGKALTAANDWSITLEEYARTLPFMAGIAEEFIFPFVAASWGAPIAVMRGFPAYDVIKVIRRRQGEGLWFFEFEGGSTTYVNALVREITRATLRTGVGVASLAREGSTWRVRDTLGAEAVFDQVVVATSAPAAAELLSSTPEGARHAALAAAFKHFDAHIVIHRDVSFMPASRRDWCLLNITARDGLAWNTEWAGYTARLPVFRTWLPDGHPMPADVAYAQRFKHVVVTTETPRLQRQVAEMQGHEGIYLVGMYTTDVDNHESALKSAHAVARMLAPTAPNLARFKVHRATWESA